MNEFKYRKVETGRHGVVEFITPCRGRGGLACPKYLESYAGGGFDPGSARFGERGFPMPVRSAR